MRRKPFIFLFLLLVLSIGGAVFHHQLQKEKSSDSKELDLFLRDLPASSGRELHFHQSLPSHMQRDHGWWDRLGIRREDYIQCDLYYIRKIGYNGPVSTVGTTIEELTQWLVDHREEFRKGDATLILNTRRNGKLDRVGVFGSPASEDFIIGRFPKLRPYVNQTSP